MGADLKIPRRPPGYAFVEREKPKVEVENLILQTGGVKSLISCLHEVTSIENDNKTKSGLIDLVEDRENGMKLHFHFTKNLKMKRKKKRNRKMPDSAFTRLFRS